MVPSIRPCTSCRFSVQYPSIWWHHPNKGPMSERGPKIILAVTLLFIVASALVWDAVYRGGAAPAQSPPDSDRLLVLDHGGRPGVSPRPKPDDNVPPRPRPRPRPQPTPRPTPEPSPDHQTYTVSSGDCLSLISGKVYGTSVRWPEIAQANGLSDPYTVVAGQTLTIP